MTRLRTHAVVLALTIAIAAPAPGTALGRDSGFQRSPDGRQVLVSKDVAEERWVIVRGEDGTVAGNVFRPGGGAPLFVWCEPREDGPGDGTVALSCFGASACPAAPCDGAEWDFIADVDLPGDFFAPPASPAPTPAETPTPSPTTTTSPAPSRTPAPTVTPSSSSTPTGSATPVGTVSPEPDDDVRCCVPDDGGTECEDRTPAECAARGGVNLGPGSCSPDPCS